MEPIRAFYEARHDCLLDVAACDPKEATEHVRGSLVDDTVDNLNSLIADDVNYIPNLAEIYFVQHFVDSEVPLIAQVWTCEAYQSTPFTVDGDGNRTEGPIEDRTDLLVVFHVAEVAGEPLKLEIIDVLDEAGDPEPEGGTCDSYREWPPPPPSS